MSLMPMSPQGIRAPDLLAHANRHDGVDAGGAPEGAATAVGDFWEKLAGLIRIGIHRRPSVAGAARGTMRPWTTQVRCVRRGASTRKEDWHDPLGPRP